MLFFWRIVFLSHHTKYTLPVGVCLPLIGQRSVFLPAVYGKAFISPDFAHVFLRHVEYVVAGILDRVISLFQVPHLYHPPPGFQQAGDVPHNRPVLAQRLRNGMETERRRHGVKRREETRLQWIGWADVAEQNSTQLSGNFVTNVFPRPPEIKNIIENERIQGKNRYPTYVWLSNKI